VASLAIGRKSDLLVIWIRSSVVIPRMAAVAISGSALITTAYVAGSTVQRRMLAGQSKSRQLQVI
jgi:hypothetical protein